MFKSMLEFLFKNAPVVAELLLRLLSKNPKFFKIVQIISVVIGVIASVLGYLAGQGIELPASIAWLADVSVVIGAITAIIMAQLPNPDPQPEPEPDAPTED